MKPDAKGGGNAGSAFAGRSETTTPLLIQLNAEERMALQKARLLHPRELSEAQFARLLIRDGLIGMGDLALPGANRSKWAGAKRHR